MAGALLVGGAAGWVGATAVQHARPPSAPEAIARIMESKDLRNPRSREEFGPYDVELFLDWLHSQGVEDDLTLNLHGWELTVHFSGLREPPPEGGHVLGECPIMSSLFPGWSAVVQLQARPRSLMARVASWLGKKPQFTWEDR